MEKRVLIGLVMACVVFAVLQLIMSAVQVSDITIQSAPNQEQPKAIEVPINIPKVQVNEPATHKILLYEDSVDPAEMTIKQGDTVKWTNMGANRRRFWINEEIYSDLLEPEQSYSYTFNEPGEHTFRDVFNGLVRGTIKVESSDSVTGNILQNIPGKYRNVLGVQLVLLASALILILYPYKKD